MPAVWFVLAQVGCGAGEQYIYQPTEQVTATIDRLPAARYPIPPESPRGDVTIASFGITTLSTGDAGDFPVLHVRLLISNDAGTTPWSVDTRNIRVSLGSEGVSRPAFANAAQAELPFVRTPRGEQSVIDLYYPLAESLDEPEDLPGFDVLWGVQTDTGIVAERTPFERVEVVTAPYAYGVGYGAYW